MNDTTAPRGCTSRRRMSRLQVCVCRCLLLLALSGGGAVHGFVQRGAKSSSSSSSRTTPTLTIRPRTFTTTTTTTTTASLRSSATTTTALRALLDVPEGFFTLTFISLGIFLSVSKSFARVRMEENAWEGRLADARRAKLAADPTLTEIDVRRQEAALEWSAYGQPPVPSSNNNRPSSSTARDTETGRRSRQRVQVMDVDDDDDEATTDDDEEEIPTSRGMTDAEITAFELEYNIKYDPYYDEPYDESELPNDMKCTIDRRYGDRIYENGEIFYKDPVTGLFYRQGAKPRNLSFWS